MVNEHAVRDRERDRERDRDRDRERDRDAEWSPDRRPGKKARLSAPGSGVSDPRGSSPSYPSPSANPDNNGGPSYSRPDPGARRAGQYPDEPRSPPDRAYPDSRPYPPAARTPSPPAPAASSSRLLLANLSYQTTEDQLTDLFRDAGAEVDRVRLVKVTPGNRVNGNAYVWLRDRRSVDIALSLDGREFLGRTLRVSDMPEDQRTACVRGLRPRSTSDDVHDLFRGCNIVGVRSRPVKGGPADMNTWFVDFGDEDSFSRALAKDRTAPGLMICIATAQGRGPRASRDKLALPPHPRDDYDRSAPPPPPPDYDRRDDRDRDRDRKPADLDPPLSDRNGLGNGGGGPPPRGRSRSRSRSPYRGYDRDRGDRGAGSSGARGRDLSDRDRDYCDRRRMDYDRGYSSRLHDRDRRMSPPREERYRERDHDRGRDRDMDRRRDYRRESDPWGDRDRDHRRDGRDMDRDRDHDRDRDRDYRRMDSRGGRHDRDHREARYPEPRDRRGDQVLDPVITAVLTNLPFCENREHVIDTLGRTLEDLPDGLKIQDIIPVGRRCGACIVIFRDAESQNRAVHLQSISITGRKVNILPLEVPSVARVQKLAPGYSVNDILDDMQRQHGVETLFVKMKQADQLVLGVEDSRFLVRLLDIDGRPLLNARYATVSYIPSRHYSDNMANRTRPPRDEYEDPNGRGGSYRDRDNRDDRGSPGGADRRRSSDMGPGDRRENADEPRRGDSRPYHHTVGEWKLRVIGIPVDVADRMLLAIFENVGVSGLAFDRLDDRSGVLCGGDTGESDMEQIVRLINKKESSPFKNTATRATVISHFRKRSLPGSGVDGKGKTEHSPSKKLKTSPTVGWKAQEDLPTVNPTQGIHISPMTPSPGDYTLPPKVKKQPLDPMLPETCKRLETLRSAILDRPEEDDSENYEEFCRKLHDLREPQTLVHTMSNTIDPIPPQVWCGNVRKGPSSRCNGFLVLNSNQSQDAVRKTVSELPKEIKIEHRGKWEDEAFAHLLKPEAVVIILKAADDVDSVEKRTEKDGKALPKSKEVLNGILRSLRGKQKMGISRYTLSGKSKKYVALCIPPNPYMFEKMRVPWRARDYAGHDSLLLVVGPKNPEP